MAGLIFWPVTDRQCREGVAEAYTSSWYVLQVPGGDTLYFNFLRSDTVLANLSVNREAACSRVRSNAFFISFSGRVLTASDTVSRPDSLGGDTLLSALRHEWRQLGECLAGYRKMWHETEYYRRTHTVADEGFHEVMARHEQIVLRCAELERCRRAVDLVLARGDAVAHLREERTICCRTSNAADGRRHVACRLLKQNRCGPALWQVADSLLPVGCHRFRLIPFPYTWFHLPSSYYKWWGRWGYRDTDGCGERPDISSLSLRMRHGRTDIPMIAGADGSPVLGPFHNLNGMWAGGRFHSALSLFRLSVPYIFRPQCMWQDLKASLLWVFRCDGPVSVEKDRAAAGRSVYVTFSRGDSIFYGQAAGGLPAGEGVMHYPDGGIYSGHWVNGLREGYGKYRDSQGIVVSACWRGDSLPRGRVRSSAGDEYEGQLNRRMEAHGEGVLCAADGEYYAGKWRDGKREGFGFSVSPNEVVRCGVWSKGRFRGEQMIYHSERVYGIDISKYQHIHKRKTCAIDWKNLRITHLGHISEKKVQGHVDYPVSFVYIKATEGLTVYNPWYERDVRAARRHGYPVGAYHFFSERPAASQADYFLKKARPRRGDLPPMLDVELSDLRIGMMGGREVLFREILVWMKAVECGTGATPVLYVSQDFVNRYMPFAPEELKAYPVWVARYGEYKPYVHLLYWQLSPDGRVNGIKGHVDIDVFNGSDVHFREYLQLHGVK